MSRRADYTDDEWELVSRMPTLAALGAMAAQADGPLTSTRELWAGIEEMTESAKRSYPENALIQAIMQELTHHPDDPPLGLGDWHDRGETLPEAIVEQALLAAANARRVLAERAAPDEAAQYRTWIIGIARAGVEAVRTGFLGLSGARVTARESRFLEELAAALGAPEDTAREER